ALCLVGGNLERVRFARPPRRQVLDGYDPHARIPPGELAGDIAGAVGAAIVDHDDFEPRIVLGAHRREAIRQRVFLVLRRDDGRYQWGRLATETWRLRRQDVEPADSPAHHEIANRPDRDERGVDPEDHLLAGRHGASP